MRHDDSRACSPKPARLIIASPEIGVAVRQGDQANLVAVDDQTRLKDPEFGGADLIVGVASLHSGRTADNKTDEVQVRRVTGPITTADAGEAARLVAFVLRPEHLPARDLIYADLVKPYQRDPAFRP